MSRNSIDPVIWGPHFWRTIHYATVDYPEENPTEEEKTAFLQFFRSLQWVLPCETCREHYQEYWKTHPIALENKKDLLTWALSLHNHVNERSGKKLWSLTDFQRYYEPTEQEEEAKELSIMQPVASTTTQKPLRASNPRMRRAGLPAPVPRKNTCKNCKRQF